MTDPSRDEMREFEHMLERSRPGPRPTFRGDLRRRLLGSAAAARPAGLRRLIAGYAVSGLLLLAVAAAGLGGIGPLAA